MSFAHQFSEQSEMVHPIERVSVLTGKFRLLVNKAIEPIFNAFARQTKALLGEVHAQHARPGRSADAHRLRPWDKNGSTTMCSLLHGETLSISGRKGRAA